ncbi:hypothetical protein U1Q18_000476 [Sarracenia purpurea var. burkii]
MVIFCGLCLYGLYWNCPFFVPVGINSSFGLIDLFCVGCPADFALLLVAMLGFALVWLLLCRLLLFVTNFVLGVVRCYWYLGLFLGQALRPLVYSCVLLSSSFGVSMPSS